MRHAFFCIDGHTEGNPVRLVVGGAPRLVGSSASAYRLDFLARHDWIRTSLMFEPRGHDLMSGGFVYPPFDPANDALIVFMETSGCLPMCGHGTIGILTFALEHGLIEPKAEGRLRVEVPAGLIEASYKRDSTKVTSVTLRNVPSYLAAQDIAIDVPGLGPITLDLAYGGNFYAIIEPQGAYQGVDALGPGRILSLSPLVREQVRAKVTPVHPADASIRGVSHVLWADSTGGPDTDGRNAVFYGDKAIDRSPCGTGTSARMAQLWARGRLKPGDTFVHESIIRSRFIGGVAEATTIAGTPAIVPTIEGRAWATGHSQIWVDDTDPFWRGFQVV